MIRLALALDRVAWGCTKFVRDDQQLMLPWLEVVQFSAAELPTRPDVLRALTLINQEPAAALAASTTNADWEPRFASATVVAQTRRSEAGPGARAFLAAIPPGRSASNWLLL